MNLDRDGYTILPGVVSADRCKSVGREIEDAFQSVSSNVIETNRGSIVGGRNLIDHWNGWPEITQQPTVARLIARQMGPRAGLVRILYFDKPPGHGWSLSLHRDQTIAVAEHHCPALPFSKPTRKAGVPHVEATESLLKSMLTLRLHLDPMRDENGPLIVVPGSHQNLSSTSAEAATVIHCDAGDVFVMRPLLLHGSRGSSSETKMHRRVIHLEMAPNTELPSSYRWHRFEFVAAKSVHNG